MVLCSVADLVVVADFPGADGITLLQTVKVGIQYHTGQ